MCCVLSHFSRVQLFATPWTVACQATLSTGFARQDYWSGFPFPSPGDLPDSSIKPFSLISLALAGRFFTTSSTWEARDRRITALNCCDGFCHTAMHIRHQIRSVAQSCPILCDPMNLSTPGLPVHHQLPEFTQTHVQRVSDAIQPSHPLPSPSPLAPNPSQHQSLFQ